MKHLRPRMTYESPSRAAEVWTAETSEPASGSVSAKAATERPERARESQKSRTCSGAASETA